MKRIAAAIGIAFICILAALYGGTQATQPTSGARPSFDHSYCQYPDRTTNPVDGCDSTDPCDPEDAAKGGSGECR